MFFEEMKNNYFESKTARKIGPDQTKIKETVVSKTWLPIRLAIPLIKTVHVTVSLVVTRDSF